MGILGGTGGCGRDTLQGWRPVLVGALLAIGALGLFADPSQAQYFGQNKVQYRDYVWQSIRSDHFEIYFYEGLDSLARRVMDLAEKTDRVLSARMGHQLTRRIPIILYGSHNDFSQTNVTRELIDAGTGGFTEALRNRVVLPFTGSYEDLRHVVVHELVHAYMFDLLYGGAAAALLARQSFYAAPLWFAEGLAEYLSLGMESNAEMFLRDGAVAGYLPPLPYAGGFLVYKQGQSALGYFVDRFGEERLRELLRRMRMFRNFDRAFERTVGMPVDRFDSQWRGWLRKRHWPTVATLEDPEVFARRLTDHRRDESNLNTTPAISPRGDRVAYVSDRKQYTDVYVMSAFDGAVLRRVIRGERNVQFEALPSFRGAMAWSPDGTRLALTARSGGKDRLYIVSADRGRVLRTIDIGCASMAYPAWSPVGDSLVVAGVREGRSDLWLIDLAGGGVARLTDDTHDEKEPTWSPDGRGITFASDRSAPVVLHPGRQERGYGGYGIHHLDLAIRSIVPVLDTPGEDTSPAWSEDGRRLAFVSDRGGASNIYLFDRSDSTIAQLTDVLGGVSSLSWSRTNDRLVFAAFNRGGYDIFAVREPLSGPGVMDRMRADSPQAVMSLAELMETAAPAPPPPPSRAALGIVWPESLSVQADTASSIAGGEPSPGDSTRPRAPAWKPVSGSMAGDGRAVPGLWAALDTLAAALPVTSPLVERGGPFAVADSVLAQPASPYRGRLSADYAGAGFYVSTLGVVGASQFLFSDFLGNHSLLVSTDVFSNSLSETNALVLYSYLPRRWDVSGGLFHFKNYFSSNITTLGEQLGTPRLFAERNFGVLVSGAYPFDRFRRVELGFVQMFVDRTYFAEVDGGFVETGQEFRSVTSPSVSVVGDNTLFGYHGPVNGSRHNVTFSPSFDWFKNGLSYRTLTLDTRRYWDLGQGYTLAGRLLGGVSSGRDPQAFQLGGFSTLRGYPDFDLDGSRFAIANLEARFPFIQQLGLVGPVPLGVFQLRGALFTDVGMVWNRDQPLRAFERGGTGRLQDVLLGFGTGVRTSLSFLILKLDVAWNSDLRDVSRPRWHFSIGPEF